MTLPASQIVLAYDHVLTYGSFMDNPFSPFHDLLPFWEYNKPCKACKTPCCTCECGKSLCMTPQCYRVYEILQLYTSLHSYCYDCAKLTCHPTSYCRKCIKTHHVEMITDHVAVGDEHSSYDTFDVIVVVTYSLSSRMQEATPQKIVITKEKGRSIMIVDIHTDHQHVIQTLNTLRQPGYRMLFQSALGFEMFPLVVEFLAATYEMTIDDAKQLALQKRKMFEKYKHI